MPEFKLDTSSPAGSAIRFDELEPLTQGYVEALFFTSEDELGTAAFSDLAPRTLARIIRDCTAFRAAAGPLIDGEEERAGRDFWFTRNGHGVGFWEAGRWPEPAADTLDRLARVGGVDAYLGDDGKVYMA